jgi:hypothetical protein
MQDRFVTAAHLARMVFGAGTHAALESRARR